MTTVKQNNKRVAPRLFKTLLNRPAGVTVLILSGLLTGLANLGIPFLIGRLVDCLGNWSGGGAGTAGGGQVTATASRTAGSSGSLAEWVSPGRLFLLLLFLYVTAAFFHWLLSIRAAGLATGLAADLRREAFNRLTGLPLGRLDRHPHGDFLARLTADTEAVSDGMSQLLIQLCSGSLIFLGSLYMMLRINVPVALAVLLVTPLCFFVTAFINKRSRQAYAEQATISGQLNDYAGEQLEGRRLLVGFDRTEMTEPVFGGLNDGLYEAGFRAQFFSALTNPGTRFVNNIAYVLVGMIAVLSGMRGALTPGAISALLTYALQFAKPLNEISGVTSQFQNALAGANRLFKLIEAEPEDKRAGCPVFKLEQGEVAMEAVTFSYTPDRPLIENLNLELAAGGTAAIVGPTGAGKTTLVNLLMGFYELDKGKIEVDGQDLSRVQRSSLRRSFGMVLQDSWVFSGTVHANIAYGAPTASREQVVEAAKRARLHEAVMRLPQGYDTVLEQGGAALSAGEKQLISIARVMLINPDLLILDEATSSIDTRTERLIGKVFDEMMAGKTSFIIAHRLSTIRGADTILVMEDGRIVQQGTHVELLAQEGLYRTLYNSQFEALALT